jgi:putative heme-binding domain-containing protein
MFGNFSLRARVSAGLFFWVTGLVVQPGVSPAQSTRQDPPIQQSKQAVNLQKNKLLHLQIEAANRLNPEDLSEAQRRKISQLIDQCEGTADFVKLVDKFSSAEHYSDLLRLTVNAKDRQLAADAMGVLLDKKQTAKVQQFVINADDPTRDIICDALVNCGKRPATSVLTIIAKRADLDNELRTYAIKRLGQIQTGARDMLAWIDDQEDIDPILMPAIAAALHSARWPNIKSRANELFPIAATKDNRPLPSMDQLIKSKGNIDRGKAVFESVGTCSKCHIVHGKGIEVGPNLSEIGSKLSRTAMFESILFPSAAISHNYENWMVLKEDGQVITGVLTGETDLKVQIKDDKGIHHVISVDEIETRKKQKLSLMPADLHKEMTEQELVDLVEYLMMLKK